MVPVPISFNFSAIFKFSPLGSGSRRENECGSGSTEHNFNCEQNLSFFFCSKLDNCSWSFLGRSRAFEFFSVQSPDFWQFFFSLFTVASKGVFEGLWKVKIEKSAWAPAKKPGSGWLQLRNTAKKELICLAKPFMGLFMLPRF